MQLLFIFYKQGRFSLEYYSWMTMNFNIDMCHDIHIIKRGNPPADTQQ